MECFSISFWSQQLFKQRFLKKELSLKQHISIYRTYFMFTLHKLSNGRIALIKYRIPKALPHISTLQMQRTFQVIIIQSTKISRASHQNLFEIFNGRGRCYHPELPTRGVHAASLSSKQRKGNLTHTPSTVLSKANTLTAKLTENNQAKQSAYTFNFHYVLLLIYFYPTLIFTACI